MADLSDNQLRSRLEAYGDRNRDHWYSGETLHGIMDMRTFSTRR